jgi:hypothetical protein
MGPKGDRWWTNWVEKDPVEEHRRKSFAISGEMRLALAVFRDAIKQRDKEWLLSNREAPYSFRNLCEALELSESRARERLLLHFKEKRKRTHYTRRLHKKATGIGDIPGRDYTHGYGDCPGGMILSRCEQCTSRYRYNYRRRKTVTDGQISS